ncbi:hypothetical protein AVEN_19209-1 [Araneus ventricosus]|uniref:ATP-dependent DNA helicase n=1 Tax=Araneus ventricosus TaxID=182803 RepID=A0A4Y2TBE4_ARAVE|nr:hypothetical protein AVEN_19209-1 [Araneus ventricosus]
MPNIIEATIMTGHAAGEKVFIPRIPIIHSYFPFQFKRLHLSVRLSLDMSINKAHGQSLKALELDLPNPVSLMVNCMWVLQELEKPTICTF